MDIYYTGTIDLDTPLTAQAVYALLTNPQTETYAKESACVDDWAIIYNDEPGDQEDEIKEIVSVLASLGYVCNGEVEYYGDYEGKIYVEHNQVIDVGIEDTGLHEASDETLIQILSERGYIVTKK